MLTALCNDIKRHPVPDVISSDILTTLNLSAYLVSQNNFMSAPVLFTWLLAIE